MVCKYFIIYILGQSCKKKLKWENTFDWSISAQDRSRLPAISPLSYRCHFCVMIQHLLHFIQQNTIHFMGNCLHLNTTLNILTVLTWWTLNWSPCKRHMRGEKTKNIPSLGESGLLWRLSFTITTFFYCTKKMLFIFIPSVSTG